VNTSKSRGKKNVADLVERVSSLQGATDWWASVGLLMLIATAIIAVLTVGAQYMSIRKGRELNRAQNALAAAKDAELIKLDSRTANRWLTTDEFKSLETAMGKFSGQPVEVVVFPVNFESVAIADLIYGILANAKWRVGLSATRLIEPAQLPTPAGMMSLMVQGVYIRSSGDYASRTAGRALYDALSTTVASGGYDPEPIPGEPRVFVLVGDKPTPLSVWIDK
jgi:hypothetical protein